MARMQDGDVLVPIVETVNPKYGPGFDQRVIQVKERADPIWVLSPDHNRIQLAIDAGIDRYIMLATTATESPPEWRVWEVEPKAIVGDVLNLPDLSAASLLSERGDHTAIRLKLDEARKAYLARR